MVARSFNPYVTPVSNTRQADHMAVSPSMVDVSPTLANSSRDGIALDEDDSTDAGIGELLQDTATYQGRLTYYCNMFVATCKRVSTLLFVGPLLMPCQFRLRYWRDKKRSLKENSASRRGSLTKRSSVSEKPMLTDRS